MTEPYDFLKISPEHEEIARTRTTTRWVAIRDQLLI